MKHKKKSETITSTEFGVCRLCFRTIIGVMYKNFGGNHSENGTPSRTLLIYLFLDDESQQQILIGTGGLY